MLRKESWIRVGESLLIMVFLLASVLIPFPVSTKASITDKRLAGQDRFQTARIVSEQFDSGMIQDVVVASGNNFPDALSVSVLAKKLNAPILLVDNNVANSGEALDYISHHLNKTGTIHIVGGKAVVGIDFEIQLNQLGYQNIERVGGIDRYDTNILIAKKLNVAKNTPVVIACGENFPDALSIASIAGSKGWPILLTSKDELSLSVITYLADNQPKMVYVVGGTGVVSEKVEFEIKTIVPRDRVIRLAGQDRFDTNISIIKTFISNPQNIYVASGLGFPDALAGSVLAARTEDPIVLIDPSMATLPTSTASYLSGLNSEKTKPNLIALGGNGVVSEEVFKNVNKLLVGLVKNDDIYSVPDMTKTITQDQNCELPTTATVVLYNSKNVDRPVKWTPGVVETSNIGSNVFEGYIEGYERTAKLTINVVAKTATIKTVQYGTSGKNRPLYVTSLEVIKPQKVVLITFEVHGWEDDYAKDGQVLVDMGQAVIDYFTARPDELGTTSLFVVTSANPDGLAEGWTNNGSGRCQVSLGVDINRDFDYYWTRRYNARNKTLEPFSSPEARALRDLVLRIKPTDVIDIHGWLSTTYGSRELCSYFQKNLGIGYSGGLTGASGYFSSWATMYAKRTALVELSDPGTSSGDVIAALKAICAN